MHKNNDIHKAFDAGWEHYIVTLSEVVLRVGLMRGSRRGYEGVLGCDRTHHA